MKVVVLEVSIMNVILRISKEIKWKVKVMLLEVSLMNFILTQFGSKRRKSRIKVSFWILPEFLGLVNTFTAIGFSETSPVMHLNQHISRSQ